MIDIFKDKPKQWGLRGDPLFWEDLSKLAKDISSEDELIIFVKKVHKDKTGIELTSTSMGWVLDYYEQDGMSSGLISGKWWLETGIPLLAERLRGEK